MHYWDIEYCEQSLTQADLAPSIMRKGDVHSGYNACLFQLYLTYLAHGVSVQTQPAL